MFEYLAYVLNKKTYAKLLWNNIYTTQYFGQYFVCIKTGISGDL